MKTACRALLLAMMVAFCASQDNTCVESEECLGMVPPMCFSNPQNVSNDVCPTCCCASSENVEFYNESEGEHNCSAPEAVYRVTLSGAWTPACHPDYYPEGAIWSPLTGISHKPEYELWNACMCSVSMGVALVSQTGNTTVIQEEYMNNSAYVFDSFAATAPSEAGGTTSQELRISPDYQYVSVVTMLAPSADRMIGVSSLQLCDGAEWKSSVRLCAELFSTATKSDRVSESRNSVQESRCSFGHFEFTLLESNPTMQTTAATDSGTKTAEVGMATVLALLLVLIQRLFL